MRVLLLGAGGMLAKDLLKLRPETVEVTGFRREELDIRDTPGVARELERRNPSHVINCAANNRVDAAEDHREDAFAVNAVAVGEVAKLCASRDTTLVHFSTDYVFDGELPDGEFYRETDARNPVNAYGQSKLAGERALESSGARFLLIRSQWLFGREGRSFVELMCQRAEDRQATRVVNDEFGCPTFTVDLARATWALLGKAEISGVFHVSNRGRVNRYQVARHIFEHFRARDCLTPCTTGDFGSRTRRPANSPLSVVRAEGVLGWTMPCWEDAVDRYLGERSGMRKSDAGHTRILRSER